SIADGTSNTIFYTELYAECVSWWCDWGPDVYDPIGTNVGTAPLTGPATMFLIQVPSPAAYCDSLVGPEGTGSAVAISPHTGGITVGMGDGSVRLITQGISGWTWWYALTPAGGEVLGPDW